MENKSKVQTFLGFAIRSGKYRTGFNTVGTLKRVYLLAVCNTASENSVKEAIKLSKKYGCALIKTKERPLAEIIHKENAKIIAVTDKSLAEAALKFSEQDFITVQE